VSVEPYCNITLSARKLLLVLGTIAIILLAVHIVLQVWHYQWEKLPWSLRQIFDVDEEDSLPTWFSTVILFLAASLLFLISKRKRADRDRWTPYWTGLSLGFVFLSIDEIAGFHEMLNSKIETSWVIPAGIVLAFILGAYISFVFHLPPRTRALFLVSGAIFLGGAMGVEISTDWYATEKLLNTLAYNLWTPVEEGMEMGGVILFIYALVRYMAGEPESQVDIDVAVQ
jgi:hypothetical protein